VLEVLLASDAGEGRHMSRSHLWGTETFVNLKGL
jgi:hypothetical protein